MVTVLTTCSNPLYSECGLKNYHAILSGRDAAQALKIRKNRRNRQTEQVIQKIESVIK